MSIAMKLTDVKHKLIGDLNSQKPSFISALQAIYRVSMEKIGHVITRWFILVNRSFIGTYVAHAISM